MVYMEISISTGCFYFLPLDRVLSIIERSGFQSVEILGYWKDHDWEVGQNVKGITSRGIIKRVKNKNLQISSFHDPGGAIYKENDAVSLLQTQSFLKNDEVTSVIMHLPYSLKSNAGWWKKYQKQLIEKYRLLNSQSKLSFENMAPIDGYDISITDIQELNKFCNLINCFVNLDIIHLIESKQNVKESIMFLGDKIRSIHISGYRDGKRVHFTESEIDVLEYIKYFNLKTLSTITIETYFDPSIDNDAVYIKQCKALKKQIESTMQKINRKEIPFSKPTIIGKELSYIQKSIDFGRISGNGFFTKKCQDWFVKKYNSKYVTITTSCTHALELASNICGIGIGDEVIMPAFTFTATANAFVNSGAKIRFVDIKSQDMNIDENLIENAITSKTKAIVVVHYAGVSCNMDQVMRIAKKYNLYVIEDAAQAILCKYKNYMVGSIGDLGCFSFHATKNITMGEGGALLINNEKLIEKAICMGDNGIDRRDFLAGKVDRYQWGSKGASYHASDLNAAFLFAQLEKANYILDKRIRDWKMYELLLKPLHNKHLIRLPQIEKDCKHNGHIFYIKCNTPEITKRLKIFLKNYNIDATYHYTPLHTTAPGKKYGKMIGPDKNTTIESMKLLRLPLFYSIKKSEILRVVHTIYDFYGVKFNSGKN